MAEVANGLRVECNPQDGREGGKRKKQFVK